MDPILSLPYSKYDTINFSAFQGNGIPRHLYIHDDLLRKLGLQRISIFPAISFVLNENIEAHDPFSYFLMSSLWKTLSIFYRSDIFVRFTAGILMWLDKVLKNSSLSFSSSVCVYQKTS